MLSVLLPAGLWAQPGIRGSLFGSVTDGDGQPVAGAIVQLESGMHQAQTDENGRFRFADIAAGEYTLRTSYLGHHPYSAKVTVEAGKQNSLSVRLEASTASLDAIAVRGKIRAVDNLIDIQRSAMPVTVIGKEAIAQMGSRRLDEVLKEQTGVAIVSDIGGGARAVGVQMQGFGSDYVMVLIDGQPMVGRNSGNFDLSRISVSNIERIEIVKGASSCLFGSEALGGAINIVTRHGAMRPQAQAALRYGSLSIVDATLEGETPFRNQRGSANLSANYYRTNGFNTDPKFQSGTTAPPYDDYAVQGRARYHISENGTLGTSARYALRKSYMEQIFGSGDRKNTAGDSQDLTDINASLTYDHTFGRGLRSMSRYYLTRYLSDMSILWRQTGATASAEKFAQTLHRFEQQFAHSPAPGLKLTGGLGGSAELMDNRDFNVPGGLWSGFGYLQGDWRMSDRWAAVGGLRYDHHNSFGGRINPSLGLNYHIIPSALTFKLAFGSGFKTPDYRQRYQVFLNPVANYLVIGTERLRQTLEEMKTAGEISEVREYLVNQLDQNLQAERSLSFNGGLVFTPGEHLKVDVSAYYHCINNQINSIRVATGMSIRDIYTCQNLPKSFNTGLEASASYQILEGLDVGLGYQYLVAKDRGVMDSIRNGRGAYASVRNSTTGEFRDSKLSDYFGLENRSRHMANLHIAYRHAPWDASANLRISYRGKYGFMDSNNNRFLDPYDTFVDGHFLLNAAVEKKLVRQRLSLQLTADNIMDYTDRLMPGQPGRVLLLGLNYRFY